MVKIKLDKITALQMPIRDGNSFKSLTLLKEIDLNDGWGIKIDEVNIEYDHIMLYISFNPVYIGIKNTELKKFSDEKLQQHIITETKKFLEKQISQINFCDCCGKLNEFETVNINFGYGSDLDETNKQFCSNKCLLDWVKKNVK